MPDVMRIREDFPILQKVREEDNKPLIYFDNTATSLTPVVVTETILEYYHNYGVNIHRGIYNLSKIASEEYENAHDIVAKFIGATDRTELAFTKNTTEAINIVAFGLEWSPGDEIIISAMEHHSNFVPWQIIRDRFHVKLKFIPVKDDYKLDIEYLENNITKNTKLVAITHVSNVLGTINPVKEIGKIAHDNGSMFLVDGAQSTPHMPVNVKDIGCDFFAFSGHKMLGPTGTGGLYISSDVIDKVNPYQYGGGMISSVTFEKSEWGEMPWRFEAGTPNIAGGIGLAAAVKYLEKIGMNWVRSHEKELIKRLVNGVSEIPNVETYGTTDFEHRGGILPFNVKGLDAHEVALYLDQLGNVAVRSGLHCAQPLHNILKVSATVRASLYIYNTKEEVDTFVDLLNEIATSFGQE